MFRKAVYVSIKESVLKKARLRKREYVQGFEFFRFILCKNFSLESRKTEVISNA